MLTIRKNGGTSVVSLPRAVLRALGVDNGDQLAYEISGHSLKLTPVKEPALTCEELFKGVKDGEYSPLPEDKVWLDEPPTGKEII